MKFLAFADTHGRDLRKLVEQAGQEGVTHVFACGDWTMLDEVPKYFVSQFTQKGKKMFVLPGNHETLATTHALAEEYGIQHLHGDGVVIDGIGFFGAGGATQIGPHTQLTEEEMWDLLQKAHEKVKNASKKVLVVHEHPAGSVMELGRFPGSAAIRRAIEQFKPNLVLCGHIHEAAGIEEKIGNSRIVNVAKHGKILEL